MNFKAISLVLLASACDGNNDAVLLQSASMQGLSEASRPPQTEQDAGGVAGALDAPEELSIRTMRQVAADSQVECDDPDTGKNCIAGNPDVGDIYDVDLAPDCGEHGVYAGVARTGGTELRDKVPPKDEVTIATLSKGQIVCIRATARVKQFPSWYYVTVVPVASVESCAGSSQCSRYGDRAIKWEASVTGAECRTTGHWKFAGQCAAGWANADDFEVLANGR